MKTRKVIFVTICVVCCLVAVGILVYRAHTRAQVAKAMDVAIDYVEKSTLSTLSVLVGEAHLSRGDIMFLLRRSIMSRSILRCWCNMTLKYQKSAIHLQVSRDSWRMTFFIKNLKKEQRHILEMFLVKIMNFRIYLYIVTVGGCLHLRSRRM